MNKWLIVVGVILLVAIFAWNGEYITSRVSSVIIGANIEDAPGVAPDGTYPVILLHGFTGNSKRIGEWSFIQMQDSLVEDLNYQDRGLYVQETTCAELKYTTTPTIIRATFYEDYFQEDIEDYAANLERIVDRVLYCTGAEQVDIIAHSMGGVISRYYLNKKNDSTVRKLIMVGTPNHGGLYNKLEFLGELPGEEIDFLQLQNNSAFMEKLNADDETPGETQYYTVIGVIDGRGDGIVLSESVPVEGEVDSITVDCNHIQLTNPQDCEEGYVFIVDALTS